jgi:type IV pilus assembly protein PilA
MQSSRGFTLIELVTTIGVIGILSALAIPALVRAKMSGNEASAIGSLKAINAAEAAYSSAAASGNFASQLSVLATPCPGQTIAFISSDLAADPSMKSGYSIALGAGTSPAGEDDCSGVPTSRGYYVTAVPLSRRVSGRRGFATSSRQVIYTDASGAAPTEAAMLPGGAGTPLQ